MDAVVDVLVDMLYVVIALMFVCKFANVATYKYHVALTPV